MSVSKEEMRGWPCDLGQLHPLQTPTSPSRADLMLEVMREVEHAASWLHTVRLSLETPTVISNQGTAFPTVR